MATRSSRSVSVPVKVVPTTKPVARPIVPAAAVIPKATPKPAPKLAAPAAPKISAILRTPEEARRRIMWWVVSGATAVIIVGWVSLWDRQYAGRSFFDQTLSKIKTTFSGLSFGAKPTAAEKEIRQLDKQVFPDLSK